MGRVSSISTIFVLKGKLMEEGDGVADLLTKAIDKLVCGEL